MLKMEYEIKRTKLGIDETTQQIEMEQVMNKTKLDLNKTDVGLQLIKNYN